MTEEGTATETGTGEGQATEGIGEGQTTQGATGAGEGQSEAGALEGTAQQGTQNQATEETFFDPQSIQDKPELMAAYKGMQRAFAKKMEGVKGSRQKIEAYDAFAADPVTQIQAMAKRMGYQITRADATQVANVATGQGETWEPKSWDEVLTKAEERAYQRLRNENQPMMDEVQGLRKTNLERFLDDNAPDWRQYEDDMMTTLKSHPSLVNDPLSLYRISVPPEVLESRATQAALKKMKEKGQSAQISGASTTTKETGTGLPNKSLTFDEAVKAAQKELAEKGIRPGQ